MTDRLIIYLRWIHFLVRWCHWSMIYGCANLHKCHAEAKLFSLLLCLTFAIFKIDYLRNTTEESWEGFSDWNCKPLSIHLSSFPKHFAASVSSYFHNSSLCRRNSDHLLRKQVLSLKLVLQEFCRVASWMSILLSSDSLFLFLLHIHVSRSSNNIVHGI